MCARIAFESQLKITFKENNVASQAFNGSSYYDIYKIESSCPTGYDHIKLLWSLTYI